MATSDEAAHPTQEGEEMNKLAAIESALSKLEVGDNLILHTDGGRIEYILELKAKEESK